MPRLARRDPFAVRALVAVLVVATFFAAGGERMKRVAAAFDWQGVMVPANFRIDAWVSPPTYTGRPPVILQGLRPGEPVQTAGGPLVEGAFAASVAARLGRRHSVDLPITEAVAAIIDGRLDVMTAMEQLMTRPIKAE